MNSLRIRKSMLEGISPWEAKQTEEDQNQMTQFCHQMLPPLKNSQHSHINSQTQLQDKLNQQYQQLQPRNTHTKKQSKRPVSNVYSTRQNPSNIPPQRKSIFQRLSSNIPQAPHNIKSAHKPSHQQLRPQSHPLQQINVRNYIMQGSKDFNRESFSQNSNNNNGVLVKKKESSYVMKQKFVEIRRSMNLQLGIWGSVNKNNGGFNAGNKENWTKTVDKEKENIILRHLRYELI